MKLNPIVLSALAVAASSPSISAAPFPAGSGQENSADTITTPQPNESLSPRAAEIGSFARRASMRGGQRRSSGKQAKDKQQQEDKKVKRGDLLGSLGGGAPPSAELAGYQNQVQTGLNGLGLGQLGGPVNGVLGTASGLEASVQGTLNGLGLGAVNGVARSVLGTVNGLEDSVQGTVKGLGLPEPIGSTVGNLVTTAKGVQGQALSQLNVVPPSSGSGQGSNQSPVDVQNQLNGLGLSGLTGLAGGALSPVNGLQGQLQGQLAGLGLGAVGNAIPNAGDSALPKLDPSILTNILSTPNGIAALNNLTPAQLSALGLGGVTNAISSPQSDVSGIQTKLQGLGLGSATGALGGIAGNLPLSGLANGASGDPASALHLPQSPLGALSDPQAVQKLLLSQAQEIEQLEKLVLEQNQKLASTAAGAGAPVGWPNPPVDQIKAAINNNALLDTAKAPGVFDSGLYNNKLAVPQDQPKEEAGATDGNQNGDNPDNNASSAPESSSTALSSALSSALAGVVPPAEATAAPATFAPQGKVFANLNPSKTSSWIQTTSGWPWPMDASHLPPPIPAITSWGVKMVGANASARENDIAQKSEAQAMSVMSAVPPPASAYTSWGVRTVGHREDGLRDAGDARKADMLASEPTSTTPSSEPMPSPTGVRSEGGNMERRSRMPKSEDSPDDASGESENQSAPDSPGSFHSAKSSPSTPSLESAQKSIPSVSGGAEGPQVVLGDSKSPISTQNKRSHGVPHVQEPQDPDEGLDDDPKAADLARRHEGSEEEYAMKTGSGAMRKRDDDEEEEHEDDPAEDNSENVPKAEPQAEAEPEEDPVTVSPTPDLPVPLPKTLPAQPALHSKAHRVHKKDDSRKHEYTEDHHHSSMAFASPGGRPAMRRQQAYTPEHRHEKHDKDKTVHVHIHHSAHSGSGHNHKRDEGHGEEGPELPAAPIFDPAGTSQDKDALKSANYVGQHAQMSPDCWEAMAAGKHMEHAQKRLAKLKRRNAMPDMANAASGNLAAPPRVSAHPPSYQAAIGNIDSPDPEEDDGSTTTKDGKRGKTPGDKKKKKKEKEPKKEREPASKNGEQEKDNRKKESKQSVADMEESAAEEEEEGEMRRAKLFRRRIVRNLSMKRWL